MRTGPLLGAAIISSQLLAGQSPAADKQEPEFVPQPLRSTAFTTQTNAQGVDPRTLEALTAVRDTNRTLDARSEAFTTLDFVNASVSRDTAQSIYGQVIDAALHLKSLGNPDEALAKLRAKSERLTPAQQTEAKRLERSTAEKGQDEQIVQAGLRILSRSAARDDDLLASAITNPATTKLALYSIDLPAIKGPWNPPADSALGPKAKTAIAAVANGKDSQLQLDAIFTAMGRGEGDLVADGAKSFAASLGRDLDKGRGPALAAMMRTFADIEHPSATNAGKSAAEMQPVIERMLRKGSVEEQSVAMRAYATFHTNFGEALKLVSETFASHPNQLAGSVSAFLYHTVQYRHQVSRDEAITAAKAALTSPKVTEQFIGLELCRQLAPDNGQVAELSNELGNVRSSYAARVKRGDVLTGLEQQVARYAGN